MRARRVVQVLSWTSAMACGLVAALPGAASATKAPTAVAKHPVNFQAQAFAAGVRYVADSTPALAPIPELVAANSPEGIAALDSTGSADGIGSSYDPRGASGAASIYCIAAPSRPDLRCPKGFPPPFPLTAHANYPTHKDATATSSGTTQNAGPVLGFTPGNASAHADLSDVNTHAATAKSASLGGTPAQAGNSSASADTHIYFDKGSVVVEATSVVQGVDIAGAIHIGGIVGFSTARLDGTHVPQVTTHTTVSDVTVAGQSATLNETGIHVLGNGSDAPTKTANDLLQALAGAGVTIRLVGDTTTRRPGGVNSQAGGVLVSYKLKVPKVGNGIPPLPRIPGCTNPFPPEFPIDPCHPPGPPTPFRTYIGSQAIGSAGIDAQADNHEFSFTVPPIVVPPVDGPGAVVPPPTTDGTTPISNPVGGGGPGVVPTTGNPVPSAAPGAGTPVVGAPVAFSPPLDPHGRLRWLALGLLLGAVAFVAGRFGHAPARLPSGSR